MSSSSTSVLSSVVLINATDLSYAQTTNANVVLYKIIDNEDGSATFEILDHSDEDPFDDDVKTKLIVHLVKKTVGALSKREKRREKNKDREARKIIQRALQHSSSPSSITSPDDTSDDGDTDAAKSAHPDKDSPLSNNDSSDNSFTDDGVNAVGLSPEDVRKNLAKALETRRLQAVQLKQEKAARKKEAQKKRDAGKKQDTPKQDTPKKNKHNIANPIMHLMLKHKDKKECCAKTVEQFAVKNAIKILGLNKSRSSPLTLAAPVVKGLTATVDQDPHPPQSEFTFSSPRTMSIGSNASTTSNLSWKVPTDSEHALSDSDNGPSSPVIVSVFDLQGNGIESLPHIFSSAKADNTIRDRDIVELDDSEHNSDVENSQPEGASSDANDEDVIMTNASGLDKHEELIEVNMPADDEATSVPAAPAILADNFVADFLQLPNAQQYPPPLSASEKQSLIDLHITPLPSPPTKKNNKPKKVAKLVTENAANSKLTVIPQTPAVVETKSWMYQFLAVPNTAEYPRQLSLAGEAKLVELHVAPLPVTVSREQQPRKAKKVKKTPTPLATVNDISKVEEIDSTSAGEVAKDDATTEVRDEAQPGTPATLVNDTSSSEDEDEVPLTNATKPGLEQQILQAHHTFLGTVSLTDFVTELDFDLDTGKVTKDIVGKAFTTLHIQDHDNLTGRSCADIIYDVRSPAVSHRIRLGAITLAKFFGMITFDDHDVTNIKDIIDAFNKAAEMEAAIEMKLRKALSTANGET